MLKKLYIHNFKSFWDSSFEFGKVNCLIAPNNSGKSNLIEAIEYIDNLLFNPDGEQKYFKTNLHYPEEKNTILKAEFEIANRVLVYNELIDYKCNIEFYINIGEIHNIDVKIDGKVKYIDILDEDKVVGWSDYFRIRSYGAGLDYRLKDYEKHKNILDKKRYSKFAFNYNQNSVTYGLECNKSVEKALISLLGLNLNNKNELLRPIDFKNIFSRYSVFASHYFHPHTMKYKQVTPKELHFLNKDGTSLVSYLSHLNEDIFEDISTSIIGEVEKVNGLELTQEAHKRLWFLEDEIKIPIEEISDGTIHFVAIMGAILGNQNSIAMMIEEPERHMHMKVLSYILNTMRDDDKQIFFTTHSTEMLSELELDEILFMFRDYEGDTKGIRAKDVNNITKFRERYNNDLVSMIQMGILDNLEDEL
jgi:predicted ATP-dependent endonuclease of OLD family